MPGQWAWFEVCLAAALPGTTQKERLDGDITLAHATALIHAHGVFQGHAYIWPDPARSTTGRALLETRHIIHDVRTKGIEVDL